MKKTLLAINIFFLVFIMPLNVMNDQKQSYAALEIKQYFENVNISVEIFEEQISLYTHITKTEYGEEILYDDVYSGAFIDDDGILNICLVNGSEASAIMDERIRFTSQEFSLNYLMEIYDNLISIMEDYSISEVNIDERENKVNIMYYDTRKQTEINEYLFSEKLYNNDAVNLQFDQEVYLELEAKNVAYGGSQLNKWGWSKVGTLCVNAIDNDTGEYGILTNDHVAVHRDSQFGIISSENLYLKGFAGAKIGKASKYNNKTIDAAFVPFTNQNDWEPTTYAKYENTIYDNVKMGSNDFIIQGMPVKKIGLTSGISTGYIISSNVAKGGLSNIFSYSNNHAKGDSGGPVYYDDGQNLFLIGMHFAGDYNNDGNPIGNGYSCKMTEIARILNVTPLTNNSVFDTTLLPNDTIRINQVNYVAPNGEVTIPSSLYGKSVSQIGTSAFANITSVTSITIPETITFIGDYAFENCTNLEFVSIPNNSATIGKQPFKGCTKIYGYITSKNSSQHRNINIFGELSWGDHIYSLGECSICDWVHENHTHIIIGTPSYHYQDCTICHDRVYCSGTAIFHSYNENSHSYLCGTCDEMLTASHTYNNGVCTICNYHHQGHIYDAHYNGTQSSHYLECLTCGYENYCPSNASLVSQTDTMHTYTCNNLSCNYTKTEDHNYNTSQICIDCDYHGPGTHSHLFTHYYIPVSSTGEFMGFKRHLAYCACGDSKLMACIGEYLGPETEVYCTLCGQYMGGGGLLFSFTLPNGDVYLSTEKITLDDYMGLARFLGIEYKMSDYYDVLVSFTSNSYVLEDYFIIIEEK